MYPRPGLERVLLLLLRRYTWARLTGVSPRHQTCRFVVIQSCERPDYTCSRFYPWTCRRSFQTWIQNSFVTSKKLFRCWYSLYCSYTVLSPRIKSLCLLSSCGFSTMVSCRIVTATVLLQVLTLATCWQPLVCGAPVRCGLVSCPLKPALALFLPGSDVNPAELKDLVSLFSNNQVL